MVPAGWDSWGKIKVLRDRFDPSRVGKAWQVSLKRPGHDGDQVDEGEEGIEDLWVEMIPDTEKGPKVSGHSYSRTMPVFDCVADGMTALTWTPRHDGF